jgi:hypothetical protein
MHPFARRSFLAALAGASLLPLASPAIADDIPSDCEPSRALKPGARFGRWKVAAVTPFAGALLVEVEGASSGRFTLEVMARDDAGDAVQPVAKTKSLAVFVRNGGNGNTTTDEDQGLAAITLARRLELAGEDALAKGLLTHRQRLEQPDMKH